MSIAGETQLAVGADAVWVRLADGSVARIDPSTNGVTATIAVGSGEFGQIKFGEGGVWVTSFEENKLSRIDPASNSVVAAISVGGAPEGLGFTPRAVWVASHHGGTVSRIDPATNSVVATIPVGREGSSGPKAIVIAAGDVWTNIPNTSSVVRIDPDTNSVISKISFESSPEGLISGDERLYVSTDDGRVSEISTATNRIVRTFDAPSHPNAFGLSGFWMAEGRDLTRLDTETLVPVAKWQVFETEVLFARVAFGDGSLWLAPLNEPYVLRVAPQS